VKESMTTQTETAPSFKNAIQTIIDNKQPPAHTGKPVFEKHLDAAKMFGAETLLDVVGKRVHENDAKAIPLNLGAKDLKETMPEESRKHLLAIKKAVNNFEIQAACKYHGMPMNVEMLKEVPLYKALEPMLKAYNVSDFSTFLQTVNARFYFEEYEIPYILADEFDVIPMDAPTVNVPGDLGFLEGREETDVATFSEQSTSQANFTVISRNNVTHVKISEDLMSDSAPKHIEKLRRDVLKGSARAFERALINGDTTIATSVRGDGHQDTDTRALALNMTFAKAFDGLRKRAFAADTAFGAGSFVHPHGGDTASKLMFARLLEMAGKMASEKDDLRFLLPQSVETQLVTGAIPELFTAFAFGGMASNVTGRVPPVFGIKSITSPFMREDLNASGVYASGATQTAVILFKKSRFAQYLRQGVRVWAAPTLPNSDQMLMTSKIRHSFGGNPLSLSEKSVVMAIDVASRST
jgi:hypothetical protein